MLLEKGRPNNIENRLVKEIKVYDLLDNLGIEYERVDHEALNTMEACMEVDNILNAQICKNLFLRNQQKTRFYLLIMKSDKKFKTKELSNQINSARLSFAEPEYMEMYLDITPGSASVLSLMNDTTNYVTLLIDEDLLKSEYIGMHPCINTSSLRIKTEDIINKFLKYVNHSPTTVTLKGED